MTVYRLSRHKYAYDLSGRGAEISGGRWNPKGYAALYTGESRALCMAEVAVHLPYGILPMNYCMISIEIPAKCSTLSYSIDELADGWNQFPYIDETQQMGREFLLQGKALVLKVPSAVVEGDHNYIINPEHAEFKKVRVTEVRDFSFDARLFKAPVDHE